MNTGSGTTPAAPRTAQLTGHSRTPARATCHWLVIPTYYYLHRNSYNHAYIKYPLVGILLGEEQPSTERPRLKRSAVAESILRCARVGGLKLESSTTNDASAPPSREKAALALPGPRPLAWELGRVRDD